MGHDFDAEQAADDRGVHPVRGGFAGGRGGADGADGVGVRVRGTGELGTGTSRLIEYVETNLAQAGANLGLVRAANVVVTAKLAEIEEARWRLIRNRRLLREVRRILNRNEELLASNRLLFAMNEAMISGVGTP